MWSICKLKLKLMIWLDYFLSKCHLCCVYLAISETKVYIYSVYSVSLFRSFSSEKSRKKEKYSILLLVICRFYWINSVSRLELLFSYLLIRSYIQSYSLCKSTQQITKSHHTFRGYIWNNNSEFGFRVVNRFKFI